MESLTLEGWEVLAGGLTSLIAAFWAGMKWMAGREDERARDERLHELLDEERRKVEAAVAAQIDIMKGALDRQEAEIRRLRSNQELYVRQIGVLEGLLRALGQDVPPAPRLEPQVSVEPI